MTKLISKSRKGSRREIHRDAASQGFDKGYRLYKGRLYINRNEKQYPTFIHEAAKEQDKITVSGGRLGLQITLSPDDLCRAAKAEYADIINN